MMQAARLSCAALMVGLAACSAPTPEKLTPTRWPTRCNTDVVPFLSPFGLANTKQTVTFHFRANIVCNTTGPEPRADIELRTPSNELVPIESVKTGRVDSWLGEANVFTVSVVTRLPDVSVKLVRATIHVEGQAFTRDVFLVSPPDEVRTLSWSPAPAPFTVWWQLGPDERVASTESGFIEVVWFYPQGQVGGLSGTWQVAATPNLLVAGGALLDRVNRRRVEPPRPVFGSVAAMRDELFMVSGSRLLRLETDGGETLVDTFSPALSLIRMAADDDHLMLGFENSLGDVDHVEIRARGALGSPGTTIDARGRQLIAGDNRMWMVDGDTVTVISGDGGTQSIARPTAGFPAYRDAPGPKRPAFIVPTEVASPGPFDDHPLLWIPMAAPDGGLTSMFVAVESSFVAVSEQAVFINGKVAPLPP